MRRLCSRPAVLPLLLALATVASPAPARARRMNPRTRRDDVVMGRVVDAAGKPLGEAAIHLVELDRVVRTDDSGLFSLPDVAPGTYTLEVRRPGFRTAVHRVTVPSDGVEIRLEEAPFTLDPLTVSVTRSPLDPAESPLATAAMGAQELARDRSVSLAHTLARLPGVRALTTGGEIGKPVIRGLSGARVLVLSQGLRLEDYAWSDEDGPAVDAALVDRVEVVRGPASVLYGADAVGGVVNVVPRPLPETSGASFFRTEAELSAATNNREAGLVLRGEGAAGPWGYRTAVSGRFAEALHTPVGELENTGFGAFNAEAALVRRGSWGSVTARLVHHGGEFKLLEEDAPPGGMEEEEEAGPERKLGDQRLQLLGNFPLGAGTRLEARLQGQRHNIIEMEDDPAALARGERVEVPIFDLTLSTGLAEVLLHHTLAPGTSGTVGVTGKLQHSTTAGVLPVIPGADASAAGVFILERVRVSDLTLLGGARFDASSTDAAGADVRAFNRATWSLGATARVAPGTSLSANVGTAWRAPTLFELFASGPRLGEARYEIGREDLEAERSTNVDVGLRVETSRVRMNVSAYRNDFSTFLFIQPTDEVRDGYAVYRYAQAEALLRGVEGSLEVEAAPWLTLSAGGDVVRGTNETRDEPLPLMPPRRFTAGAEVHGAWPSPGQRAWLGAEVEAVAQPSRINSLDLAVDDYALAHLSAGVEGRWRGREAGLSLRVSNLANTRYHDFLSRYKAFAMNPGRNVVLRLRMGL